MPLLFHHFQQQNTGTISSHQNHNFPLKLTGIKKSEVVGLNNNMFVPCIPNLETTSHNSEINATFVSPLPATKHQQNT
jgi:hypothetical protein